MPTVAGGSACRVRRKNRGGMSHRAGLSRHSDEALEASFTKEEQVTLNLLIVAIKGRNRIPIGCRAVHPVEAREAA
jgi:hypothetical protein